MTTQLKKTTSNKITLLMFLCSIIIVLRHSSGYKYFTLDTTQPLDQIIKFIIDYIQDGIFLISMPTFFFFSGLLFYRNYSYSQIVTKYKSRIQSLLVPYFTWNIFWMIIIAVITQIPALTNRIDSLELFSLSINNVFQGIFLYKYNPVYWYMFQIIILVIFAPLIYTCLKNKYIGLIFLSIIYLCILLSIPLPYLSFSNIFYYAMGAYLGMHYIKFMEKDFSKSAQYLSLFLVLLLINLEYFATLPAFVSSLCNIALIILFWIFLNCIKKVSIKWWMTTYFFTYSFHRLTQQCINKLLCLIFPNVPICSLINFFLGAMITLFVCNCCAWVLMHYFPHIWILASGNRQQQLHTKSN